jgi:hypothetical protein
VCRFAFTVRNAEVLHQSNGRRGGREAVACQRREREREGYDQDDIFVTLTVERGGLSRLKKENKRKMQLDA